MHQTRVPMNPLAYQDTLISPQFPPKKLPTLVLPLMNLQTHIHSSADDNKNILSRNNRPVHQQITDWKNVASAG